MDLENILFVEQLNKIKDFERFARNLEAEGANLKKRTWVFVEVKYQSCTKAKIPSGLRSFIKRYQPEKSLVITQDFWAEERIDQTQIYWLPAWMV